MNNDLEMSLKIKAEVDSKVNDILLSLSSKFLDISKSAQALERGFTAITGSSDQAKSQMSYMIGVADKFGVSIDTVSKSYMKMLAATDGINLTTEDTKKIFEAMSSAMSVLGADTVQTTRAFNAIVQMMSKGQIMSEELKGLGNTQETFKQFQQVKATFSPRRVDDLRDGAESCIGFTTTWTASWVIEDGDYECEWAMTPPYDMNAPFVWVPSGDLQAAE